MRTGTSVKSLNDALLPADLERRRPPPPAPAEQVTVNHCPGQQKWWGHELSASSLASSEGGYTQQPWLPDDISVRCMLCAKPFHVWRWTHHCRDCGGLYCDACSSHRVEARVPAGSSSPTTLRLCDTCAFSPSHPRHVGCKAPCACPRCMAPQGAAQLLYYAKAAVFELLAAPFCCFGLVWPYICAWCASSADARMRREKLAYSLANQPTDSRPQPLRIGIPPPDTRPQPLGIEIAPPDTRPQPVRIGIVPPDTRRQASGGSGAGAPRGASPARGPPRGASRAHSPPEPVV